MTTAFIPSIRQGNGTAHLRRTLLEAAKLRYPEATDVMISLGHTYLKMDKPRIAAGLFEEAALMDSKYIAEAAELYLLAGEIHRALFLNAQVRDQKKKCRQRLNILLKMKRFEEAAALEARLSRLGLLDDEDIRFAVAYTCFKTGRYDDARAHLSRVVRPDLFRAASELMRAIDVCRESDWQCL